MAMAMTMRRMRHKSKVSAPIPPLTPDRKQQQRRTQRQFCYCNRGAAAMECAMTWLGNNHSQSPGTVTTPMMTVALRFQANAPPLPVTPSLPDPTVVTTRTTRPNRSSRFTNGHGFLPCAAVPQHRYYTAIPHTVHHHRNNNDARGFGGQSDFLYVEYGGRYHHKKYA
jgi:hypothetical protein